jgi:hypothetical protein
MSQTLGWSEQEVLRTTDKSLYMLRKSSSVVCPRNPFFPTGIISLSINFFDKINILISEDTNYT